MPTAATPRMSGYPGGSTSGTRSGAAAALRVDSIAGQLIISTVVRNADLLSGETLSVL